MSKTLNNDNKLNIIAEVAQGFEGNIEQSKLLVKAASSSGADIVKFQLVFADELSTKDYKIYSFYKSLEMSQSEWKELSDYCKKLNIKLCFEVFGKKSLNLAKQLKIDLIKVHGTDVTNIGLLQSIKSSKIEIIILGIGGAYWMEIEKAISLLSNKKIILLIGFQDYPTKTKDNQIERINFLNKKVTKIHSNFKIGFADHTQDNNLKNSLSIMSLGAGATVIEKHITLGKNMKLEDFESALNPDEFLEFVNVIKSCFSGLIGFKEKNDLGMTKAEKNYRKNIRRHVVSTKDLIKGKKISPKDLTLKRTSSNEFISNLHDVYDREVLKFIPKNTAIKPNQIK